LQSLLPNFFCNRGNIRPKFGRIFGGNGQLFGFGRIV